MKGIDVSKHNGAVNWTSAAAAIDFAIIRAGYGKTYVDPWSNVIWQAHRPQGCAWACIITAMHSRSRMRVQRRGTCWISSTVASLTCLSGLTWRTQTATRQSTALRLVAPNISAITQAFIDTIRAAGYQCGVYASKSWFEDYISVDADAIWLAQWASKPTYAGKFDVWQNSDSGTVPGVTGKVDTNVLYTEFWKEQEEDEEMKVYTHTDQMPDWASPRFTG